MNGDAVRNLLRVPFRFKRRPEALPGDLRPDWRIAAVLLILNKCHGSRATLRQLHVISWAIRDTTSQQAFLGVLNGARDLERPIVRIEPSLNRAVDFAVGEGLVERGTNDIRLTKRGSDLAQTLYATAGLLDAEKTFLGKIHGKITRGTIQRALEWNDIQ